MRINFGRPLSHAARLPRVIYFPKYLVILVAQERATWLARLFDDRRPIRHIRVVNCYHGLPPSFFFATSVLSLRPRRSRGRIPPVRNFGSPVHDLSSDLSFIVYRVCVNLRSHVVASYRKSPRVFSSLASIAVPVDLCSVFSLVTSDQLCVPARTWAA